MARFNAVKIRNLITNIFIAEGMKQADAEITANALIDANLCGRDSHGILRVLTYVDRIRFYFRNKFWKKKFKYNPK